MNKIFYMGLLLSLLSFEAEAKTSAQQAYQNELDRVGIDPVKKMNREAKEATEDVLNTGFKLETEDSLRPDRPDDDRAPELNDMFSIMYEDQTTFDDDIFVINGEGTMEGQQRLQLNPDVLRKIELPPEEEKLSWWDEMVNSLASLFS